MNVSSRPASSPMAMVLLNPSVHSARLVMPTFSKPFAREYLLR